MGELEANFEDHCRLARRVDTEGCRSYQLAGFGVAQRVLARERIKESRPLPRETLEAQRGKRLRSAIFTYLGILDEVLDKLPAQLQMAVDTLEARLA